MVSLLNPVIRGWVNFQKYNVSSQAFERFDFDVWRCLWQWCKRRHPKKSHKWIAKKYFKRIGTRSWTFSVKMPDSFELSMRVSPHTAQALISPVSPEPVQQLLLSNVAFCQRNISNGLAQEAGHSALKCRIRLNSI